MRITRYPSITEQQFLGCNAAFVDSLAGELNAAAIALRHLEGRSKGAAFAHEMTLDVHRYGALIVLDRWSAVVAAFGPHLSLSRFPEIISDVNTRVGAGEEILSRANRLMDGADQYSPEIVRTVMLAFQSVNGIFQQERTAAEQSAALGPMLPEEYRQARHIFLEDLAAR